MDSKTIKGSQQVRVEGTRVLQALSEDDAEEYLLHVLNKPTSTSSVFTGLVSEDDADMLFHAMYLLYEAKTLSRAQQAASNKSHTKVK